MPAPYPLKTSDASRRIPSNSAFGWMRTPCRGSCCVEQVPEGRAGCLEQELVVHEFGEVHRVVVEQWVSLGHDQEAVLVEQRLHHELGLDDRQVQHRQVDRAREQVQHQ